LAVQRAQRGWHDFQSSGNDLFLDSVSLSLQGAYNGVEVVFELIARLVDRNRPKGENWHQLLLGQMMAEVDGIRPAVISVESGRLLNDFRGFDILPGIYIRLSWMASGLLKLWISWSRRLAKSVQNYRHSLTFYSLRLS
jgi:hypothetical protein